VKNNIVIVKTMSRFAGKKGKRGPGAEFTWDTDPGGEPDTAPTPLYPVCPHSLWLFLRLFAMSLAYFRQLPHPQAYVVPYARKISSKEQAEVDKYRRLREAHHEGPYYSVIDASASSAKKGSAARANFDPFTGMPSYSGRYQKKHRTIPKIAGIGRDYGEFPRNTRAEYSPCSIIPNLQ
jgi:DNA-directed RNA polymerase III subunit RPC7